MDIMTDREKTILRTLDGKWNYIMRDGVNDMLKLSTHKPVKEVYFRDVDSEGTGRWGNGDDIYGIRKDMEIIDLEVFNDLFQFISWENEYPFSIEVLLELSNEFV